MKMNIFYLSTFILFTFLYSCSSGPANDPRTIYTYQTMQTEMLIPSSKLAENKSTLKEISEDKTEPEIQRWAINALFDISKMEKSAGETLKLIEDAKQLLFLQMGENLKIDDKASIRYEKFDIRFPLYPARYDLSKVKNNETTDVLSPDGTFAKKIQFSIKQLRKVLTETAGFHKDRFTHETLYYFKDPNINTFSSRLDLRKQIEQSNGFKHVALDDQELILRIYEQISFTPEFWETSFGENISWIEAFGFLISLQSNILNATNEAVTCIQYTYGSCGCIDIANFAPLVTGEERLLPGQNPKFEVLLAGIMSHKTPIFKVNGAKIIHIHDGVATITAEMGKDQEKTITGTLTIFNKSGIPKTYPWKKTFYREPN